MPGVPSRPLTLATTTLFGLEFTNARTLEDVCEALLAERRESSWRAAIVATPNVDALVRALWRHEKEVAAVLDVADVILADGQPIVWASRLLGRPLHTRLAGSSLVAMLWPRIAAEGRRTVVIAASEQTARSLRADGCHSALVAPKLAELGPGDVAAFVGECVNEIRRVEPEFVFVAIGRPAVDLLVLELASAAPAPRYLGVGASFEMYYGVVRRAPRLFQRLGLEWLFRLVQEPRRLWRRYLVDDAAFIGLVVREWRTARGSPRSANFGEH